MTTCTTTDLSSISFQRKATALITVTAFTTLSALITIATFIALIDAAHPPL